MRRLEMHLLLDLLQCLGAAVECSGDVGEAVWEAWEEAWEEWGWEEAWEVDAVEWVEGEVIGTGNGRELLVPGLVQPLRR